MAASILLDELEKDHLEITDEKLSFLPRGFSRGSAVVFKDNLYILGGAYSSAQTAINKFNKETGWTSVTPYNLPISFFDGSAVVYNDEIHILGGTPSNSQKKHYKWNGEDEEWTSVSTLPYEFYYGSAVVYNDEIHILGGGGLYAAHRYHHYLDSTTLEWVKLPDLPYNFYNSSAVVYNNEIHILGTTADYSSDSYFLHYKWNGEEWTKDVDLPYSIGNNSAVVYNNEIHILGGSLSVNRAKHYKYDGEEWTSVSTLPYEFYNSSAVIYEDELYMLGGGTSSDTDDVRRYISKWDGDNWFFVGDTIYKDRNSESIAFDDLPYDFWSGNAIIYNDEIHILGGSSTQGDEQGPHRHYKWDEHTDKWSEVSTLPTDWYRVISAVLYHDEIHIMARDEHYKWNGSEWSEVSTLPINFGSGHQSVVYHDEIHIMGGFSNPSAHYKWNGSEWSEVSTLPYPFDGGASVVVYKNEIHILGGTATVDGTVANYKKNHWKWDGSTWSRDVDLPYEFDYDSAIVYNGRLHLLGDVVNIDSGGKNHYVLYNNEWLKLHNLDRTFHKGSAVVYNDEIHILGGDFPLSHIINRYHNSLNSIWEPTSILPYDFDNNKGVVVYNDEIHILGGDDSLKNHYKWDGEEWTSVSTLPYDFHYGCSVTYQKEIHILGGDTKKPYAHYKWNGEEWASVSYLPYKFIRGGCAVVYEDYLHILGGSDPTAHYVLLPAVVFVGNDDKEKNTFEWVQESTLPYEFNEGCTVIYHNEIHILGGFDSENEPTPYHYKYNGKQWSKVSDLPYSWVSECSAVVWNNEIHILGSNYYKNYKSHYKWNETDGWSEVSTLPYDFKDGSAVVCKNELHILGGSFNVAYGNNYHFKAFQKHKPVSQLWKKEYTLDPITPLYTFNGGDETFTINASDNIDTYTIVYPDGVDIDYEPTKSYVYTDPDYQALSVTDEPSPDPLGDPSYVRPTMYAYRDTFGSRDIVSSTTLSFPNVKAILYEGDLIGEKSVTSTTGFPKELRAKLAGHYKPKKAKAAWIQDTEGNIKQALKPYYRYGSYKQLSFMHNIYDHYNSKSEVTYNKTSDTYSISTDDSLSHFFPCMSAVMPVEFLQQSTNPRITYDYIYFFGGYSTGSKIIRFRADLGAEDEAHLTLARTSSANFNFRNGCIVRDGATIHLLGGGTAVSAAASKYHYWNAYPSLHNSMSKTSEPKLQWTSKSTLPMEFNFGSAVLYHDQIHILGGEAYNTAVENTKHYYYDGSKWVLAGDSLAIGTRGSAVVYKDKIYHAKGYQSTTHRIYTYSSSEGPGELRTDVPSSTLVVWKDRLFAIGSYGQAYMYNDEDNTWLEFKTKLRYPFISQLDTCFVHNDKLYLIGCFSSGDDGRTDPLTDNKDVIAFGYCIDDWETTFDPTEQILDDFVPARYYPTE